ncbi:MAG: hypothetical protein V4481_04190 [Patescibacteria group bacterium]
MTTQKNAAPLMIVVLIILIGAIFAVWKLSSSQPQSSDGTASSTPTPTASSTPGSDQTISDGTLTFIQPSKNFGLAVDPTQILVKSYIPPCSQDFLYCFYYTGNEYASSTFESAGVRVEKRPDLATERLCLNTPPTGFDASMKPTSTKSENNYSSSVFGNVGDAAAGHYSSGSLYRLFVRTGAKCYEFETRVGQSRYENYPAGTIKEFTTADAAALQTKLKDLLSTVSLPSGEKVLFP